MTNQIRPVKNITLQFVEKKKPRELTRSFIYIYTYDFEYFLLILLKIILSALRNQKPANSQRLVVSLVMTAETSCRRTPG